MLFFLREKVETVFTLSRNNQAKTALRGLFVILVFPILLVLLTVTIIGIPFALLLLGLGVIVYFVGKALVAILVGRLLLERFLPAKKEMNGWALVIGVFSLWIVFSVPVIGGIVSFIVSIVGLGLVTYFFKP